MSVYITNVFSFSKFEILAKGQMSVKCCDPSLSTCLGSESAHNKVRRPLKRNTEENSQQPQANTLTF